MATDVTPDARTDGGKTGGATSLAWNHTLAAGMTNPFLVVSVTTGAGAAISPTSVQWDALGTPESLTQRTTATDSFSNCKAELWGKVPTATGTKQVKVNLASSVEITGGSSSHQFVNQVTPYDTATTPTTGNSTTSTLNVTSSAHARVISCLVENGGSTLTLGASQTVIHVEDLGASFHAGTSSDKAGAAGTVAMTVNGLTPNPFAHVGVSLIFDGGGGGGGAVINDHNLRATNRGQNLGMSRGMSFHRQPQIAMRKAA